MGGNAFKNLPLVRVKKELIPDTIKFIVDKLEYEPFTLQYANSSLMGSTGKKESSGDIDFALNNQPIRFVGQQDLPVFSLRHFASRVREVLPETHYAGKTLRGGQIQTAWPIAGNPSNGLIQVDFVEGPWEFILFSHWAPGDRSYWAGVLITTLWGVMAKMRKDYEEFNSLGERFKRVGLRFDLEHGLKRVWQIQSQPGQGTREVTPDEFETKTPLAPRFTRIGNILDPASILRILYGTDIEPNQVETFEDAVQLLREIWPERYEEACRRTIEAFLRSSGSLKHSSQELADFLNVPNLPWFERDH